MRNKENSFKIGDILYRYSFDYDEYCLSRDTILEEETSEVSTILYEEYEILKINDSYFIFFDVYDRVHNIKIEKVLNSLHGFSYSKEEAWNKFVDHKNTMLQKMKYDIKTIQDRMNKYSKIFEKFKEFNGYNRDDLYKIYNMSHRI